MIPSKTQFMNNDIFGTAISDYFDNNYTEDITVTSPDFDDDTIPVPYLFRKYPEMPHLEQKALQLSYGKVLDVGCGAGSHALYLKGQNLDITAIDISKGAIKVCQKRGIKKAIVKDILQLENNSFDTILLLMNGSGIIGKLDKISTFLDHLKTLITPNGQVLLDSSNISYLFEDEDGGFWVDTTKTYFGEMRYQLKYKNQSSDWFDWLYLDFDTLAKACVSSGWTCELVTEGQHYDYLAKLCLAK